MSKLGKNTNHFVVDTNVFVAAIKPFTKKAARKETTNAFTLLVRLITDDSLELSGNTILVNEYRKFAQELDSPTSKLILEQLVKKMQIVKVKEETIRSCKPYLPENEAADIVHAATCLQTGATLITNDGDFCRIKEERLIEVWSISYAIRRVTES